MKAKFSLRRYLKDTFTDDSKRKSFIVSVVVFIVVFVGLTLYQQSKEKAVGDVIVTNGSDVVSQSAEEDAGEQDESPGIMQDDNDSILGISADDSIYTEQQTTIFVDVGGAVQLSGLFALPSGSRVADAIEAAGGLRDEADVTYLNRATVLIDGDRLYVPTESEVRNGTAPPSAGQVTASGGYSGAGSVPQGGVSGNGNQNNSADTLLINLNTASSEELQKLSGVGSVTAQKIIDYREKRGGFKRIEDLMNVSGIGTKTFEKLKDYIIV